MESIPAIRRERRIRLEGCGERVARRRQDAAHGGRRIPVARECRIGIEAPGSVKILRGEIADQVAKENQRAATAPVSPEFMASLGLGAPVKPSA